MGLINPDDLEQFRRDEAARQSFARLRAVRAKLRPDPGEAPLFVKSSGTSPDVLIAMDSPTISCRAAVMDPVGLLDPQRVAVVSPAPFDQVDVDGEWRMISGDEALGRVVRELRVVLTAGDHVPGGAAAHRLARRTGAAQVVVQHGMLLPQAAPLPAGVHVAAWSTLDAEFWLSGRDDCTLHVLGSQLLDRASKSRYVPVDVDARPVYVGALHGTELPRREIERVARGFCRATGASYRPHPSETDLQSRVTHAVWKQLGIEFEDPSIALLDVAAPLVGMWSTGILEAISAKHPAWVFHPDPPAWLVEVWHRYGLTRWGGEVVYREANTGPSPAALLAELVCTLAE